VPAEGIDHGNNIGTVARPGDPLNRGECAPPLIG
jgi:hypothetical protein